MEAERRENDPQKGSQSRLMDFIEGNWAPKLELRGVEHGIKGKAH